MNENIPIYAIICMTKLEELIINDKKSGFPDFGATAFMGFYYDKDLAFQAVKENRCDIAERCYKYAVVERILPGLYSYPRNRWFFEYNAENDRYFEIPEPAIMKHIANVL